MRAPPYRVAALLSKHPELYRPYGSDRSLTRGRTSAFVFRLGGDEGVTRHYFEFFVCPEGAFVPPPPILKLTSTNGEPEPAPRCISLNEQLILAIRHLVIAPASGLSAWHPEFGVWLHGDDPSNAVVKPPAGPA